MFLFFPVFFPPEYHPISPHNKNHVERQEVKRAVLAAIAPMASVEQVRALLVVATGWDVGLGIDPNLKWNAPPENKRMTSWKIHHEWVDVFPIPSMGLVYLYLPFGWFFLLDVGKYTVRPMGYGKWVDLPASSSFVRFQGSKV